MKGKSFKEPIFHGVVEGRITQFREIVKPQPISFEGYSGSGYIGKPIGEKGFIEPRYKAGETVYLKEPYRFTHTDNVWFINYLYGCKKQEFNISIGNKKLHKILIQQEISKSGWCNKLFMPEWCTRYFIKITAVRCERLQDISDKDCLKEGITDCCEDSDAFRGFFYNETTDLYYETLREAYAALIDSISGRGTWDSNPYVWVYEFTLISKSFDQILEDNKDILND